MQEPSSEAQPQTIKWIVYGLLLVDFGVYLFQDVESARYILSTQSSLLDVARVYVTSIDLAAWFTLILLLELETRRPAAQSWSKANRWTVRGIRLLCCAAILHTSFAYDITLGEFRNPRTMPNGADVCAYQGGEWSFLRNREYLDITSESCTSLAMDREVFGVGAGRVITDRAGLREGTLLAWTDLIESLAWLMVVALTELQVRLQRAGRISTLRAAERGNYGLYALILGIAIYWGSKEQYLYPWDELIWIGGFLVIDWNIRWRTSRGDPQDFAAPLPPRQPT